MKKTRFTETQIVSILKQQEGGISTKELDLVITVSEVTI
jgi:putative transposase